VLSHLAAFLAIAAVVICTPGPDTALTIRNALAGGRRGGLSTAAGVAAGQLAWTVATSLGLAGLLVASEPAFAALRWAGAAYLVFLGVRSLWAALRSSSGRPGSPADNSPRPVVRSGAGRGFRQGLLSNLANPKMAAFFLSLLPQFIPAGTGSLPGSLLLGAIFCGMTFIWLSGYALVVHRVRHALLRGPVRRVLDALAGTVLVGFGIRLALSKAATSP
jgi:threonine/homoserine/homoserine lactone efflux protein